ncbi:MAG: hypothetical protein ACXV8O_08615 [Methylobacter sp.]
MTPRELTIQAWNLYEKLIDLDLERNRRNRQDSELKTGYSGRRNVKRETRLHRLSNRAYKRYKRRLAACLKE